MFYITDAMVGLGSQTNLIAYLDPGTGSMVLQVLIAGVFSSLFFIKSTFAFVKHKVSDFRVGR